ncbi:YifB family Mg chelatase-like AAA ATPase [Nocardioides zeae]|uniref:YifB family Mg chelatase-like AAA ATPase n=1 Tax=Nocardioides imazamoxiresistens TaxID=3231893 RepID=A0ABU3PXB2_9ACTN|nr:YifB family Mg chelatase-like AAA ATPase [Nocardioides zeae]MDT9593870.1 YifB family Mg chelatase-like AAA ATPase [Nocardioides zeae]
MAVATTRAIALHGAVGHLIDVQVDVSPGMVTTIIVGRPDAALSEARDRCRMAIANSGFRWPTTRRTTILLSPADLPKRGTHFDLAVAVAVLAASVDPSEEAPIPTDDTVFIGELSLDGGLRPTAGVLPMTMAAAQRGVRRVFVPEPQAAEAALVPGMAVFGMRSLAQVVAELRGEPVPDAPPVPADSASTLLSWRGQDRLDEVDMADLVGAPDALYAATVAAAGGHHLLLTGAKGAGKTTLAERIPGILPDLAPDEALELTAVLSLSGALPPGGRLVRRPPYAAPHHNASATSILGGGSGRVRPGELSRAHHGVLFLDEFPLFASDVVEALRQPLESGDVTIARGEESATFPARGIVVLAANPCPCGAPSTGLGAARCSCDAVKVRAYDAKLKGPLADRVDIVREMQPPTVGLAGSVVTSAHLRSLVTAARARQQERYAGTGWRLNAHVPTSVLRDRWPLDETSRRTVEEAVAAGRLTRRGATRVHRMAWTLADLEARSGPTVDDVDTALRLRRGDPLALLPVERLLLDGPATTAEVAR